MCHVLAYYLAFYLAFDLAFYLSYLLAFYLANLLAFYLAFNLALYLAYLLAFYLTFYLAYLLAFYLAYFLAYVLANLLDLVARTAKNYLWFCITVSRKNAVNRETETMNTPTRILVLVGYWSCQDSKCVSPAEHFGSARVTAIMAFPTHGHPLERLWNIGKKLF